MKNYSSIPAWTLLRRTTFAKSSASKFFPFNKKAFRAIDCFSLFLFPLICSSKKSEICCQGSCFPGRFCCFLWKHILPCSLLEPKNVLRDKHLAGNPFLWKTTHPSDQSFNFGRVCQLTALTCHTLITPLENMLQVGRCLYQTPPVRTEWKFCCWL